jgi:hypothetical protein
MRLRAGVAWAVCAGVLGLALGSCASDPTEGYSFRSTYAGNVRSIAVPMFQNMTQAPGLDRQLTEAVTKELQRSTPWLVTTGEDADTSLTGTIRAADQRLLSVDRITGLAQELAVTVTVDFEWRDNRTGKVIVSQRNFSATDTFVASRPSAERLEQGEQGAVGQVARDIVTSLRSAW